MATTTNINDYINNNKDSIEDEVTFAQVEMVYDNEKTGYAQMLQLPRDLVILFKILRREDRDNIRIRIDVLEKTPFVPIVDYSESLE
ncbi:hypothetical protein OsI_37968 [Oryza sativa Indica Group]|uniref:Uncharacterized protein n=1 Tax=Oryza sativa subsp. indica TaxID=39946 RepID=A2ZJH8_ORYSI|nr:hypothetical protein OsI_37968 [Oryza sativa Indica Group]